MRCLSIGLLAAAISIALTSSALAAPGKNDPKPEKNPAEAIRKALDKTGKFEFTAVNLGGVLNTLGEEYKINIVLDRGVLQLMGLEPEVMNVELKLKEGTLRSALRAITGQYSLTYVIVGDALVVTTEEMAVYRQLKQRVTVDYDAIPLNKALKEMATKYAVTVVFDPKILKTKTVENPVTLQVDDVPFEAAVRLMCEMAELKPARMGNVIYVTTEARADKLKDGDSLVPTPRLGPQVDGQFLGLGGLGGVVPPLPVVPPPAIDKDEKKDDAKKDDPTKKN